MGKLNKKEFRLEAKNLIENNKRLGLIKLCEVETSEKIKNLVGLKQIYDFIQADNFKVESIPNMWNLIKGHDLVEIK